jgi:vacuolar protein sorting-associated protein 13A/C
MERLSINLQVQRSIVPTAINLAQFKVSGTLPSLQINLSDVKYKALMRIVDVAIPKFDDDVPSQPVAHQSKQLTTNFQLPPLFGPPEKEYDFDDENDQNEVGSPNQADNFFDATDGSLQVFVLESNAVIQFNVSTAT